MSIQDSQETANAHAPDPDAAPNAERRLRVHTQLLAWYAIEGRRHLPWRHTHDPYAVLVSEMMLQQTQVERVLPKYIAFLAQFPSLAALAAAPTADVIKAWAGLGYNMRAVRLQEIARQAVSAYGGSLPATLDGLLALKGIGRYTAGAVACFAFELPVATVDTNIRRVLWRVFRGIEPLRWPSGERAARETLTLAEWALPVQQAYDWQQALMDLGATICVSRRPLCERCPLASECAAFAETAQLTLFPSGEALARIRDERAAEQEDEGDMEQQRRVAETPAGYDAGGGNASNGNKRRSQGKTCKTGKNGKKSEPFEQSSRYFRGRVVGALRALEPGESLPLAEVGLRIRADFALDDPAQVAWLRTLVEGLARDGLVQWIAPIAPIAPIEMAESAKTLGEDAGDVLALRIALP